MTVFLKLGGSLITDKNQPHTARLDVIKRLSAEIAAVYRQNPAMRLVIGHGSGSFGHVSAARYGTVDGVHTTEQWLGFAEVWKDAHALNQIMIECLQREELPVIVFSPSAAVLSENGHIRSWDLQPVSAALEHGLLPVVHGDVVFDTYRGGTILATEDIFDRMADHFLPQRILLAGQVEGVWEDFPNCTRLVNKITPGSYQQITAQVKGSASVDVTGGMAQKVSSMLALIQRIPKLEVLIFSAEKPGVLTQALNGENPGTLITAE